MSQIILDATVSSQLNQLNHSVELCDSSGRVLGRFVPLIDMAEWEPLSPDVSEEELERRAKSNEKRYTTAEVLAQLEKLGTRSRKTTMSEPGHASLAEKLRDTDAITKAIQRGVREALLAHARAGHPVAGWRDGKVVWVPPEEILRSLANPDLK